jgi:AraC-like DNA-binding protein/quercetin dioxygenase-like cupin family protein
MEYRHEVVIPNDDIPFKMFIFEGKEGNYKVGKHWHQSVEIFLVTEGTIDFYVNSQYFPLRPWEFVIVNSNEIHSIDCPNPNNTIVLQIPVGLFDGYKREEPYISFRLGKEKENQALMNLVKDMYEVYEAGEYGYELKVKSLFYELLYLLLTCFQEQGMDATVIKQKRHLDKLSQVTRYMKEHYKEELSLTQVSQMFGFSPTYLSRIFQKYGEVSYRTYLINLRVEYALKDLKNTDHEIGEIAINHGFPDSRAFAKAFKKRYGCVPRDYRKQFCQE